MPTTKPRHMITETDQISQALSQAAKMWPELAGQRTLLLRKLLEVGIQTVDQGLENDTAQRLAAIDKLAGSMDGVWPTNWREELAEDWPR